MLTRFGDDELDVMELPNGMTIKMDFSIPPLKNDNLFDPGFPGCKTFCFWSADLYLLYGEFVTPQKISVP